MLSLYTKKAPLKKKALLFYVIIKGLLSKEVLDMIVVYDFLLEGISSGFGRTNHFYALGKGSSFAALQ